MCRLGTLDIDTYSNYLEHKWIQRLLKLTKILLYVTIMLCTRFRVNPHPTVA